MEKRKLQIALYWGAACGGCDVAVLDTNEYVLEVAEAADIRFWPIAVDGKYSDVEAMSDGELDLAIFNGAVRNSENERMARLLRRKCRTLVAFGSCACMGGIPGLANLTSRDEILSAAYVHSPSIEPGTTVLPQPRTAVDGVELHIPEFYRSVYRLSDVVDVDYCVPGCPPAPEQVKGVLQAVVEDRLPPRGSVLGASGRALCDECGRTKSEKKVRRFYRPHEIVQDPGRCLLEQGIVCMGSATRGGCGARCPDSNQGCRGCYGPAPNVRDQGARFLCSLASVVDSKEPAEIESILAGLPDFVSLAYRFSVPSSPLRRSHRP